MNQDHAIGGTIVGMLTGVIVWLFGHSWPPPPIDAATAADLAGLSVAFVALVFRKKVPFPIETKEQVK